MSTIRRNLPPEFLQGLRDKVDIVPLISSYVAVSRKGRNYWACCPFHHEKTPSFCIYDDEQSFHCYGCGVSGDIFTFIMKIENVDFLDAVEMIAKRNGIPIPSYSDGGDVVEKKKKKDKFLSLLKDANEHYKSNLHKFSKALDYIKMRELTEKEIVDFGIGYSCGWDDVVNYLLKKGYTESEMLEVGIAKRGENGKLYDFFAFRLMFPLFNKFGDCVGFSGRDLDGTSPAKYKNSSQSIVFDKSSLLFAYNKVKKLSSTQKIDYVILCEGQIDVISMHKAGFETAMASLGTAFTEVHAKEISRITSKVILCLDGDSAGVNATLKALPVLRANNLEIKVARLVGGKDPDEIIKNLGKEKMQEIISNAVDSVEFELMELASKYNLDDIANRTKFLAGAFKILEIFNTYSEKEVYVPLVAKLSNVSPTVIRSDLSKNINVFDVSQQNNNIRESKNYSFDGLMKSQQFILASLIRGKDFAVLDKDFDLCLKDSSLIKLYEFIISKKEKNEKINIASLFDLFEDNEIDEQISAIIEIDVDSLQDAKKYFEDCVRKIKEQQKEIEQNIILEALKQETNEEKKKEYITRLNELAKMNKLNKSGGV